MKTRAAVLWDRHKDWSVEEIDLDRPKAGEVLVEIAGSGVCHSDEHVITGDLSTGVPIIGGHEGAGIVREVGPGVTGLTPGDQVIFSFVPSCGQCRACASGMGSICELGRYMREGRQVSDHTARHHARGVDLGLMCLLGTFAEHTVVSQASCVKVEPARRHPEDAGTAPQRQGETGGTPHPHVRLAEVNEAFADMRNGRNLRGVLTF